MDKDFQLNQQENLPVFTDEEYPELVLLLNEALTDKSLEDLENI